MKKDLTPIIETAIHQALFKGEFIAAIKIYRNATGCGLKDSKVAMEAMEAALFAESPEKFTVPPRGSKTEGKRMVVFLVIAAVVFVVLVLVANAIRGMGK